MKRYRLLIIISILFILLTAAIYFIIESKVGKDISGDIQVILEIIGLPIIIIGFYIAIEEFRRTQLIPDLRLYWQGDAATQYEGENIIVYEHSPYYEKKYYLHLYIQNKGNILGNWYRIQFEIPRVIATYQSEQQNVKWNMGDSKNIATLVNSDIVRHVFKSNGDFGIYPDETLPIATWEVRIFQNVHYPKTASILTSVVTDKTPLCENKLIIKFVEESRVME